VISSQHLDKPYVYELNPKEFRRKINEHRVVGYRDVDELIKEFDWHSKAQLFQYPREFYEHNCIRL
jgi:hypothetical protein